MTEITDADLRRCQQGDSRGLEAVFRAYSARVYRLCRGMLGNDADAEDATQEVFLRMFEQVSKFSGRSAFSTWLYRLASNHCLNTTKVRD